MPEDLFGWSVAISGDVLVVGAPRDDVPGYVNAGSIHIYRREAGGWMAETVLEAPYLRIARELGFEVATDGVEVIATAHGDHQDGASGAVYVYRKSQQSWAVVPEMRLSGGTPIGTFGTDISLEGDTLVVGELAYANGQASQVVHVYGRRGGTWVPTQRKTLFDLPYPQSRPLDASGGWLVVGNYDESAADVFANPSTGAAYFVSVDGLFADGFEP